MTTTKKQLIDMAIKLVKEIAVSKQNCKVEYDRNIIWVEGVNSEFHYLSKEDSLKENKEKFRNLVYKIRGLKK